jgi:hypothetical protein|tara:strand:+ start:169 stop:414 length:246 start_codon:yes stop_codon:yes gene_type:complete
MNTTEAKLIILINSVDEKDRNVYFLSNKLEKSFSATYNYLRLLEAGDYIAKFKSISGKKFYQVKSELAVNEAKNILLGEEE